MTLSTLLTRLETATEADQAELLEMAFHEFIPMPKIKAPRRDLTRWHDMYTRFCGMNESCAYESAALIIMREVLPGRDCNLSFYERNCCEILKYTDEQFSGEVVLNTESLEHHEFMSFAIIAAICAAKGDGGAQKIKEADDD